VKLLRTDKAGFTFLLDAREQNVLRGLLDLYPLVPASHHRLTRQAKSPPDEAQRLLEESLAEQRTANRRQAEALLRDREKFHPTNGGWRLALTASEMEWLLQVINDVRVGSWLALGAPEAGEKRELNPPNARHIITLEVCGRFQSLFLAALGVSESPDWAG